MFAFLKFVFLCLLAVAAGVAAVTVPYQGRTLAELVRGMVEEKLGGPESAPTVAVERPVRTAARPTVATPPSRERPPADNHTDEDRKALDRLLGERTRRP